MFVSGGGEVLSSESTTQGDPVGMAMYALVVIPLINKLLELHENTSQVWLLTMQLQLAPANGSTRGGMIC